VSNITTTQNEEAARMAYIGRSPCGCVRAATVDDPARARDVAKEIAAMVRGKLTIERVTCESVRATDWKCPEHRVATVTQGALL